MPSNMASCCLLFVVGVVIGVVVGVVVGIFAWRKGGCYWLEGEEVAGWVVWKKRILWGKAVGKPHMSHSARATSQPRILIFPGAMLHTLFAILHPPSSICHLPSAICHLPSSSIFPIFSSFKFGIRMFFGAMKSFNCHISFLSVLAFPLIYS